MLPALPVVLVLPVILVVLLPDFPLLTRVYNSIQPYRERSAGKFFPPQLSFQGNR